jgi:hypothetical protein
MPPSHFSIFMVQRGIMAMPIPIGIMFGMPDIWPIIEGIPLDIPIPMLPIIMPRSIIIALDIETHTFLVQGDARNRLYGSKPRKNDRRPTTNLWTNASLWLVQSARQS